VVLQGLHTDFACLLYGMLANKLPQERVVEIIKTVRVGRARGTQAGGMAAGA
jgi:hypothetical protein